MNWAGPSGRPRRSSPRTGSGLSSRCSLRFERRDGLARRTGSSGRCIRSRRSGSARGCVRATGTGEVILPTPGGRGALAGPIELFKELLRGAGLTVRTSSDIDREVWRKALLNAAINPVTALHGVPNGRLIDGSLRSEAVALLTEARAVARAQGFVFGEAEATREFERVVRATSENRSSMLQDIDRGRPTEIEAISGELLRLGAVHGLDLPHTRAACVAVRARAARPKA